MVVFLLVYQPPNRGASSKTRHTQLGLQVAQLAVVHVELVLAYPERAALRVLPRIHLHEPQVQTHVGCGAAQLKRAPSSKGRSQ